MSLLTRFAAITLAFMMFVIPSYAAEDATTTEAGSFLAVSPTILAAHVKLTQADQALVADYIKSQIATNNLSVEQFKGLTADQQRQVLVPGKAFTFTRETRRSLVPLRNAVPTSVTSKIAVNQPLAIDVMDEYGIDLPASVTSELPQLPAGFQRMLVGSHLIVLDGNNVVMDHAIVGH
jgi:hypothetical protein